MAKKNYKDWSKEDLIRHVEKLEKRKKYGLVWDEERTKEVFELQALNGLPVLEDVPENAINTNPEQPTHILIEGDNFHALSVLSYTHEKSVDVIYIDPPYNTGARDWKYNNDYVDEEDAWRHSKWLSMMQKRLELAHRLLKEDGVLIVTIDDNEACTLGLLLEEIFPNKERATVVIKYNPAGTARNGFSRNHEYAYFLLNPGQEIEKKPAPIDIRDQNLRRHGNGANRQDSPTMFYPIYIDKKRLRVIGVGEVPEKDFHPQKQTVDRAEYYEIWPIDNHDKEKRWYYGRERVRLHGHKELSCKWIKDRLHVYFHTDNLSEQKYQSVWVGSEYDSGAHGGSLVRDLVGQQFPFPKSLYAVKDCLNAIIRNNKEAVIVDFFAGSGTTAHAVMELNQGDDGKRQFILVTNNENNIMTEICYPRVRRVMEGYEYNGSEKELLFDEKLTLTKLRKINETLADYENAREENQAAYDELKREFENNTLRLWGIKKYNGWREGFGGNLKYYRTSFVPAEPSDENKELLTRQSVEMLCLREGTFDFVTETDVWKLYENNQHYTAILFDQLSIPDLKEDLEKLKKPVSVYVFSLEDDNFANEFADMKDKVKICSIPEAILRVYRRIYQ